jgi:uncharacterized protein (TIGR02145 family)
MYNWYAVSDPRNLCPIGWHVPSDVEWNILIGYLDPNYEPFPNTNLTILQSEIAGGKMKSTGMQYWVNLDQDATNDSGFSGLPGGSSVEFNGYNAVWWSSSPGDKGFACARYLYLSSILYRNFYYRYYGFSVRCLKD